MMSSYRSYLFVVLLLYLLLICMLHTQLQIYDKLPTSEGQQTVLIDGKQMYKGSPPYKRHQHWLYNRNDTPLHGHRAVKWKESHEDQETNKKQDVHRLYYAPKLPKYHYNISASMHPSCKARGHFNETFQSINKHYLYSAYYDNRREGPAYVRVIGLLKRALKPNIYCHFSQQMKTPVLATFYEMCENHAKEYGGWMLSCEVPSSITEVCNIRLTINSDLQTNETVTLPVLVLNSPSVEKQQAGICVPPLFGSIPSITLIEFIELSRLLGADHFTFYEHETTREIDKVLRYYEQQGVATIMKWHIPVEHHTIWYNGQLLAINDCLYRQQHRSQYLAFNDIDEFIVPHKHSNWSTMIQYMINGSSETDLAGMLFQSAFFDPLLDTNNRILFDLESDLRTKSFSKVRTKVFIRPDNIFELGIHHISRTVRPDLKYVHVEPSVAFLHHYRKCITDYDPNMNCQILARDQSLTSLLPILRHNVHHILWTLKEIENHQNEKVS